LVKFEDKIVEARLDGFSFNQIEENKLRWHVDQIMLRGAAISGCAIPATEFFAEIISEELSSFILNFGYEELTYAEILLALRINSKGGYKYPSGIEIEPVVFFGNCFNIDYFSKVMSNYMAIRNLLDRKLQNFIDGHE
jgi:hypothetical protein